MVLCYSLPHYNHLLLHHLCGHDNHLCGWMLHIQFFDDGSCIIRHKELLYVVDDHLVHPIGAVRRPCNPRELLAGIDVPKHCFIHATKVLE